MAKLTATVFGGAGFIGRYVVERLADRGVVVRIAGRDPGAAAFLRPVGDVGQIVPVRAPITDDALVEAAVDGADWVVNLVGILYERGAQTFGAIHAEGAGRVARAAAAAGAARLVHMSALGADARAPAEYARSKAAGEEAVRKAFESAVIVRPSVVFGPEDDFFNRFAGLARFSPILPVAGAMPRLEKDEAGRTRLNLLGDGGPRFQPVYVGDVADAIVAGLERADASGKTFELGGPEVFSFEEILKIVLAKTTRRRCLVPLPLGLAAIQAGFLEYLPVPPLTRDQVKLLGRDNVVAHDALTLADLGIGATPVDAVLDSYMDRYRPGGRYTAPRPLSS